MPIYAYKCGSCGHAKDVLQKLSDEPLRVCPACGAPSFTKQVTAAGFQLKGSGWYVTDFRGGNTTTPATNGAKADGGGKAVDGAKPADAVKTSDAAVTPATTSDAVAKPAKSADSPPASTKTDAPSASAGNAFH